MFARMIGRQALLLGLYTSGAILASNIHAYLNQTMVLGCLMVANLIGYGILHLFLLQKSDKYPELEYDQRAYVVKNLTKSIFLAYLSSYSFITFFNIAFIGHWDDQQLKFLGHVYASTDLMGLLMVPGLSFNTMLHHTVVAIMELVNLLTDYGQPGLHRAIVVMAYFSILPYLVNTLLGLRHLKLKSELVSFALPMMSVIIYVICVVCNVFFQYFYVFFIAEYSIVRLLYPWSDIDLGTRLSNLLVNTLFLTAYYVILVDDINLIEYLEFKAKLRIPVVDPMFRIVKGGFQPLTQLISEMLRPFRWLIDQIYIIRGVCHR